MQTVSVDQNGIAGVFDGYPIFWKHAMVDKQSAPCRKPVILVMPFAREPNMTLRWEMDLSPGMVTSPRRPFDFVNFINDYLTSLILPKYKLSKI